jgi:hypothetical protein
MALGDLALILPSAYALGFCRASGADCENSMLSNAYAQEGLPRRRSVRRVSAGRRETA